MNETPSEQSIEVSHNGHVYQVHPDPTEPGIWHVMGNRRHHGDLTVMAFDGPEYWGYMLPGDDAWHGEYWDLPSATRALADESELLRLPLLRGSSRQIAAAKGIRLNRLRAIVESARDPRRIELEVLVPARRVTDAAWWLEHRSIPNDRLVQALSR